MYLTVYFDGCIPLLIVLNGIEMRFLENSARGGGRF